MRRVLGGVAAVVVAVLAQATPVLAHPLGNFTVNHLTRIRTAPGSLTVRYVLDEAEIPTFAIDRALDRHGIPSHAALEAWAAQHAGAVAPQLLVDVDGARVTLTPVAWSVAHRPGAGGLPTLAFTATFRAPLGSGTHRLVYRDETESGRLGWKDVVIGSEREPTGELRVYPNALIGSPRTRTTLTAQVDAAGTLRAQPDATVADESRSNASTPGLGRMNALSDVLAKGAHDPLVVLGALLLAIALGALHALEPGHGKTLLAVSLVGARATSRQALVLASALTTAHTAGVLALGAIVLLAAQWIVPEQIYPWITLAAGLFITVLGARALAREVRLRLPHAHVHPHEHVHAHPHAHDHVHGSGDDHHHHGNDDDAHARAHAIPGTAPLTFRSAVLAAATGNLAPCPAALVVLLAAIALHQIAYGLALIVAFSVGLAAVLTVLGIAVVRSAAWLVARPRFDRVARFAPLVTSAVIATVGAVMIGQGFSEQGAGTPVPVVVVLVLAAVVGYAFAWHQHRAPSGVAA